MSEEIYFVNHQRVFKFPWSLYHLPLMEDLFTFLKRNVGPGGRILIIGPGNFFELNFLKELAVEIFVADIDPRVLSLIKENNSDLKITTCLVDEKFQGYPTDQKFDLIYAKEVIEHIPNYDKFLYVIKNLLIEDGKLWISTPNYGHYILPFLEKTFLEVIARFSGFSRKEIHPSKFSVSLLQKCLIEAGLKDVNLRETDFRFSIIATAKK